MSVLVIVESPTKAKTISNYLPKGYIAKASMGHVRDLPQSATEIPAKYKKEEWAQLGVNVQKDFEPLYIIPQDKKKIITDLKKQLNDADEIILATDEDREGESISWHLLEILKPKQPIKRMVFHEITKEAIQQALKNFREIDFNLVKAQETRRILDRLVGYSLSPLLWTKIAYGLSAGRVQSVAVRLLVLRERERIAFHSAKYWGITAELNKNKQNFTAELISLNDQKIAKSRDFDENTGKLIKDRELLILDENKARELESRLTSYPWKIDSINEQTKPRSPEPPFTTSTLQQEASRKLKLSARETMRLAQTLYENGLITYMRTDSVHLSDQALKAASQAIKKMYGAEYLAKKPRQFKTKSKGAQEAHEAIRPAGTTFKLPKELSLNPKEIALYDLIWKRTIASQMAEAQQTHITVKIKVDNALFLTTGKRIEFPGFFRAYVEGSDDPEAALENKEILLPMLKKGESVNCQKVIGKDHETKPPNRYTEASLVKTLEKEGIGRPSTYATIMGTITERGYAFKNGDTLAPTFTAFAVIDLLEQHFSDLVDLKFTSKMENSLDQIAAGKIQWLPYLTKFFSSKNGLENTVKQKKEEIDTSFRQLKFPHLKTKICIGKYGPYLEQVTDGNPIVASIPKDLMPADLDEMKIENIIRQKSNWDSELGIDPKTKLPVYLLSGSYGPYVQLGKVEEGKAKPKRMALPKELKKEEVSFEIALELLKLPKYLGQHPETKGEIAVGLGRFGPYIVHVFDGERNYRSLPKTDNLFEVTFDRALEILKEPKKVRGGKSSEPIKKLGVHPKDEEPINILDGPYGPYIKYKKTNVAIPKGTDFKELTLQQALELIDEKQKKQRKKGRFKK